MNSLQSPSATSIYVRPGRQFPLINRHPWVHTQSLVMQEPEPTLGTLVDLVQPDGRWIARGLYNPASRLKVRLYSWNPAEVIDDEFFLLRLKAAFERRRVLELGGSHQAVRLVFSEADGLSGLIVDRYGDYYVVQITAAVMHHRLPQIIEGLVGLGKPQGILVRIDQQTAKAEGLAAGDTIAYGVLPEAPMVLIDHGLKFELDLRHSQKTGLYLDQRENRQIAGRHMAGRRVLDICCYVGGFSLAAAKHGASSVLGIDTSAWAVQQARRNAELNGIDHVQFETGDMFAVMNGCLERKETFDAVILDPPRFAGSREHVGAALRAYERLNRVALKLLPPGGLLVTCSCSGRVSRTEFTGMLQETGRRLGRDLLVLENRTAAPDHPVNLSCPETDYLKCLVIEAR